MTIENPSSASPQTNIKTTIASINMQGGVMMVYLIKPDQFQYSAGQYITIRIPSLRDRGEAECSRPMSVASAPHEENLLVIMRPSNSLFKQALKKMRAGEKLEIDGPFGRFAQAKPRNHPIMIAGGVGIAPLRSLILTNERAQNPQKITLIHSINNPEEAVFIQEFLPLTKNRLQLIITITDEHQATPPTWRNDTQRISKEFLLKHVTNLTANNYYIVGAPQMVRDIQYMLADLKVQDSNIETEPFMGY